jgi:hypothetical protein
MLRSRGIGFLNSLFKLFELDSLHIVTVDFIIRHPRVDAFVKKKKWIEVLKNDREHLVLYFSGSWVDGIERKQQIMSNLPLQIQFYWSCTTKSYTGLLRVRLISDILRCIHIFTGKSTVPVPLPMQYDY